jgi:ectoine hydroxylase-related dioxygenase (phytanoyl-CoA dioxygenase family)
MPHPFEEPTIRAAGTRAVEQSPPRVAAEGPATGLGALRPDTFPRQGLQISKEELAHGALTPTNRALAAMILSCRGYVILQNALHEEYVHSLGREIAAIYEDCRATLDAVETGTDPEAIQRVHVSKRKQARFWFRKSRWRIFPRLTAPLNDPRLLANPFVVPVLEDLLGEGFHCKYVSSDTCVKGALLQSPHSDIDGDDVFVDNRWRPRGYIVNVPVMECGLDNGPLEVWPGGSHMWTSELLQKYGLSPHVQDGRNPPVERVAEYFGSTKVALRPGEILIRDLAMWHRGTPNSTDTPRSMLTIGFFRADRPYGYGDPYFNLDRELFRNLDPRVRRMFARHFGVTTTLLRGQRRMRSAARNALTSWFGSKK